MHRAYHPAGPDDESTSADRRARDRLLAWFALVLGLLIGAEWLPGLAGLGTWRPGGFSPMWIAGILGTTAVVYRALGALRQGRLGADVALAQAAVAALALGEPWVAAEVVVIALGGELIEGWTWARAQRALEGLVQRTPLMARVRRMGVEQLIPADQVEVAETVLVAAGERIPVDGRVLTGRSTVDERAFSGEPLPVDKGPGDPVYAGTLNQYGAVEIEAERVGAETALVRVATLVRQSLARQSEWERTVDRLARWFLPAVELTAALTLFAGLMLGWTDVWSRTTAVLVVACPCALVLATPAALLASLAWLARHGVLVKGGQALERLAECDVFAFDKTGTLTRGEPRIKLVRALGSWSEDELVRLAAGVEASSGHPLARSVLAEAARRGLEPMPLVEAETTPGAGVSGQVRHDDGRVVSVLVGNHRLLRDQEIDLSPDALAWLDQLDARGMTALWIVIDGQPAGLLGLIDPARPEAHETAHQLRLRGVRQLAILTGDRAPAAARLARIVHADHVQAQATPADKARWIAQRQAEGKRVAMVGDGLNDAPALAQADTGLAIYTPAADLAAEAASIILLGDPLRILPQLLDLARQTLATIRINAIGFGFGLNSLAILLASLGLLGPIPAAILHQAGSLLAMLFALRLLFFGDWGQSRPARALARFATTIDQLDDLINLPTLGHQLTRKITRQKLAATTAMGLALALLASVPRIIDDGARGVTRRLGRFAGVLEPGLHLRWPWPIEQIEVIRPDTVHGLTLQFRGQPGPGESARPLLLTGDARYLELEATVQYTVDGRSEESIRHYVFDGLWNDTALLSAAESVIREVAGERTLLEMMTRGRLEAEQAAARRLGHRLLAYGSGIMVLAVGFQDLRPPIAVLDAYRDVSRAESDRLRRITEAHAYRDQTTAIAQGKASAIQAASRVASTRAQTRAASQASRAQALLAARMPQPSLVDLQLYHTALAQSLANQPKVLLDRGLGPTRLLHTSARQTRNLPLIDPPQPPQTPP